MFVIAFIVIVVCGLALVATVAFGVVLWLWNMVEKLL